MQSPEIHDHAPVKHCSAVIVAGGSGLRMGNDIPKQFLPLNGIPVIIHTFSCFLSFDKELLVALAIHASYLEETKALITKYFPEDLHRILLSPGGNTRTLSVFNGLKVLGEKLKESNASNSLVAIHDAVRPFVNKAILERSYEMAALHKNAVCCVPVKSSLRKKNAEGSEAIDRTGFYEVQTPQIFQYKAIYHYYSRRPHDNFSDDASLAELSGEKIQICEGDYSNIKITTPEDMVIAEEITKSRKS